MMRVSEKIDPVRAGPENLPAPINCIHFRVYREVRTAFCQIIKKVENDFAVNATEA
jgi:hypothetical protein